MKTSIQSRLLLFLIVSYVPVALIILWNNQIQREQAQLVVQENALQQAREIAFFHQQQIQELEDILTLLSKTRFITVWDMELCNDVIPDMVAQFPHWTSIGVTDANGIAQCSSQPETIGVDYSDRPFLQDALETGEVTVSGLFLGRVSGRATFVVVKPIRNEDGTIRGVISIGIEPDAQSQRIAQQVLRPNHRMTIIDQDNTVMMAYPEPQQWIGRQYEEDLLQIIGGRHEGTFEAQGLNGAMRFYGFTTLERASAIVLVGTPRSLAFAEVNIIQQRNLLLLAGTFIVTSSLSVLASRLIARPLHYFAQVTQQFARGDLRKRLDIKSGIIEIGQMQQAFNDMADSIEARIEGRTTALREANQQLAAEIQTRKEVEAELERFTIRLRESNRDLEQFAYVASHDLREPLRKIIGFSERLQRNNQSHEERQDYLNRLQEAATRMTRMIDNLLMYARIDQQQNTQISVDLTTVVREVLSDLDPLIKETQGDVHIDPLPTIRADVVLMHRLFQNLLVNALRYHREGLSPVVLVNAQEIEDAVQIRVRDNGVGIPEKDRERIFEIFERLHGRNQGGGSGIGLAICRKIMQNHGGEISVESVVGDGTVFILSFPSIIKVDSTSKDTAQI